MDIELPGMWEPADLVGGETDRFLGSGVILSPVYGGIHIRTYDNTSCQNPNCRRPRSAFPMAFKEDPYCSDNCRKVLGLDYPKR